MINLLTLYFVKESGAKFSGSNCGRSIWKDDTQPFDKNGKEAQYQWLEMTGLENLNMVKSAIKRQQRPWTGIVQ